MSDPTNPGYFLRVSIGFDALVQAMCNFGVLAVTISARAWTAKCNGHPWGIRMVSFLDWCPGFGKDPVTGESHCLGAWRNDQLRAQAAIDSLREDSVINYMRANGIAT
jgi:hypothetical protein